MKIVFAGLLENISTRSDGTVKLVLGSQEIDSSQAAKMFELRNKFLKILMSDDNIQPLEESLIIETPLQDGKKIKSPSQRLRAVIFRVCEQMGNKEHFEQYYASEMENLISNYKSRLDSEI